MTMFGYNVLGFGSFPSRETTADSVEFLVVAGGAGGEELLVAVEVLVVLELLLDFLYLLEQNSL